MAGAVGSSIAKGLAYLCSVQCSDGSFDSFSSPTQQPFAAEQTYRTTFAPAIILNALSFVDEALVIRTPLSNWLLAQKSPAWSFNYWAVDAPQRTQLPYPDDLDDTFCALLSLRQHDAKLIDAAVLGKAVRLLLATESKVGGPYRTWLVPSTALAVWRDVDVAVNSNVAYFLRLAAQPLPNLTTFMEHVISTGTFRSPYYPSPYPIFYYMARAYRGELAPRLAAHIQARCTNGHWGTPLQTALALSALQELGETDDLGTAVSYLLQQQQPDGSWPAEAFCLDPAQNGRQYYNGAAALTTALVLEALHRFSPAAQTGPSMGKPKPQELANQELYAQVISTAKQQLGALDPTLRRQSLLTLERMISGDENREIILLPDFFARSLYTPLPPQPLLQQLGLANLYGWMAYTIYDDFLDASGDARLLSVANTAMRYSLAHFQAAVPASPEFQQLVLKTFDAIDGANAWEVMHCRFAVYDRQVHIGTLPRYGALQRLAARSLGHALTPFGVLAAIGISPYSRQAGCLLSALKHYLIARQLHDDLHDWKTDLHAGQCSYVVARMLANLQLAPGSHPLVELLPRMRQEFWQDTLPFVGQLLLRHVGLARRDIARSRLLTPVNSVTALLDKLENSIGQTLAERFDATAFLQAYRIHPQ